MGDRLRRRDGGRPVIVGMAGHIDHGKTALVHALTGIRTDRTPEEKKRGITIELGFAPLRLDSGELISIIDVPGHEALVRTMVAGASGIDAAVVVVAADEGVMPQTREHLRVLTALQVQRGIVVLTKCDLVDPEWIALVSDDVRSALASSSLSAVPILPASSRTGDGIPAVVAALASLSCSVPPRPAGDLFRFIVDRSFTLKGTGTVVTGTVWSGQLQVGARVVLLPTGAESRVRGIHSHGSRIATATPGIRCALALADVEAATVQHGTQIVTDGAWSETRIVCADVHIDARASTSSAKQREYLLYIAGSEVRARISPVRSGAARTSSSDAPESSRVKIRLARPIISRRGDRFVLRTLSPPDTIGGGMIVDPMPERGQRGAWDAPAHSAHERLSALLHAAGSTGIAVAPLAVRLGVPPSEVPGLIDRAVGLRLGPAVFSTAALAALTLTLEERLSTWQKSHPLDDGLPLARLGEDMGAAMDAVSWAVSSLCASGSHRVRDGMIAPATDHSTLSEADSDLLARLLHRICDAVAEPPAITDLIVEFGPRADALLRFAARRGDLVAVESARYYDARVVQDRIGRLRREMQLGREYLPQELREFLGVSRKYLIPFLEYCDRVGVTDRHPGGRAIRGISSE